MEKNAISNHIQMRLILLGLQIRDQRKGLGISAVATAESAGISRITLHRIEKGVASVTMGAYLSVILALGMKVDVRYLNEENKKSSIEPIPQKILVDQYPQLKSLAWQIKKNHEITPKEALEIYERNWRHVDMKAMEDKEREFIVQLLKHFGMGRLLV
ncbi:MAG: XRE family transcriptional regulator [Bdellovibrionota bacterium]